MLTVSNLVSKIQCHLYFITYGLSTPVPAEFKALVYCAKCGGDLFLLPPKVTNFQ